MPKDNHSMVIDRVRPEEIDRLLTLYVGLFHNREPLTKCIGLSQERMMSIARTHYGVMEANALEHDFCWLARDQENSKSYVGFIVCQDVAKPDSQHIPDHQTTQELDLFTDLGSLLADIRSPVREQLEVELGTCLHVAAIGVAADCEGAGIASCLLRTALYDAQARGFSYAFAECTSSASRRLHEKAGFSCLHSVSVKRLALRRTSSLTDCNLDIHLMWANLDSLVFEIATPR
ncbi:GNAT family N-acetyltransferase [Thiocapsa imhoffii]|uniref:GNAT family N-acetyltransferase n=1 Tax=Thiocapsa imhoffii TaxID=382777 RepID=UPI001906CA70|nr:GNAT family N-acetyltransferase [Thiocapsa imhoffii]